MTGIIFQIGVIFVVVVLLVIVARDDRRTRALRQLEDEQQDAND